LRPGAGRRNNDKPWLDLVCARAKSQQADHRPQQSIPDPRVGLPDLERLPLRHAEFRGAVAVPVQAAERWAAPDRYVTLPCRHGPWYVPPADVRRVTVMGAAVRGRFFVQPLARRNRPCEPRIPPHLGICLSHACGGGRWVRMDDTNFEWGDDTGH